MSASRYTIAIGIRALTFAALAVLAIGLGMHRLYGNALVVLVIAAVTLLDLGRYIARGDRLLTNYIDSLTVGHYETTVPPALSDGFEGFNAALRRASVSLNASRLEKQRQIEFLQSLLDNMSVACFVFHANGTMAPANRAARRLGRNAIRDLEQRENVTGDWAGWPSNLKVGERHVIRLDNGQRALACTAHFAAGGAQHRLLSLENIGTELDTAEVKAWQELVRVLSHEMLNSLTPIASLATSLGEITSQAECGTALTLPPKQSAQVTRAIEAIARRSDGLMQFVERYRRAAVQPSVRLTETPLGLLVQNVTNLFYGSLEKAEIPLSSRVEPASLVVRADPHLLEQALINVVQNAVEALRGVSEPQIELNCQIQGEFAAIHVQDNGPGIEVPQLERIFMPFFTTKPGGSGIGLSLTRQIMLAHGGRIEVTNRPRGAIFTLFVPRIS